MLVKQRDQSYTFDKTGNKIDPKKFICTDLAKFRNPGSRYSIENHSITNVSTRGNAMSMVKHTTNLKIQMAVKIL